MTPTFVREGKCVQCDQPVKQYERSPGVWRPLFCGDCWDKVILTEQSA